MALTMSVLLLQSSHQGWLAQHVLLWEPVGGQLMGCVPLYLKTHSYGALFSPGLCSQLSLTSFLLLLCQLPVCLCRRACAAQRLLRNAPLPACFLLLCSCPCGKCIGAAPSYYLSAAVPLCR